MYIEIGVYSLRYLGKRCAWNGECWGTWSAEAKTVSRAFAALGTPFGGKVCFN